MNEFDGREPGLIAGGVLPWVRYYGECADCGFVIEITSTLGKEIPCPKCNGPVYDYEPANLAGPTIQ